MDIVRKELDKITVFWNYFAWNYKEIQKNLVWNAEVKTNYYGDILRLFTETFELFERKPSKGNFHDSIFYFTGLLQIIFIHQDLIDELLRIFKIESSSKNDKNPNRTIRNELVGHPIRRDKQKKLISSVFWDGDLTTEVLRYRKYSNDDKFKVEDISYKTETIITSHYTFLNKYLEKIFEKIRFILGKFAKQLKELENVLDRGVDFNKLVDLTFQRYEQIFEYNCLYSVSILKVCNEKKNEHLRYQYVVDRFKKELKESLVQTQADIKDLISMIDLKEKDKESLEKFVFPLKNSSKITQMPEDYPSELSKLYERHSKSEIVYFKRIFNDDPEMIKELNNMENNNDDNLEYYSSLEYLKQLINKKMKK